MKTLVDLAEIALDARVRAEEEFAGFEERQIARAAEAALMDALREIDALPTQWRLKTSDHFSHSEEKIYRNKCASELEAAIAMGASV